VVGGGVDCEEVAPFLFRIMGPKIRMQNSTREMPVDDSDSTGEKRVRQTACALSRVLSYHRRRPDAVSPVCYLARVLRYRYGVATVSRID